MLDDDSSNALAPYTEATGRSVDRTAIALYRLAWTLSDIAAYTALFRSVHSSNADTEKSLLAPSDSLRGPHPTRPFGPSPPKR
jgi:hypothetical protein